MTALLAGIGVFVVSFLLGSIPWGIVFSKLLFKEDVREHGSGNIGTTNMIRTYGKKVGIAVFVLDFTKGLLSGFLASLVPGFLVSGGMLSAQEAETVGRVLLGVAFWGCTWGHIFCPWLNFKGGKGIAVAIGCLFITFGPVFALLEIAIFVVLVPTTKYVSLGSVACALACPFFALYVFWGTWPAALFCTIGALTVVWAHRGNIKRLLDGTERRIGQKKEA